MLNDTAKIIDFKNICGFSFLQKLKLKVSGIIKTWPWPQQKPIKIQMISMMTVVAPLKAPLTGLWHLNSQFFGVFVSLLWLRFYGFYGTLNLSSPFFVFPFLDYLIDTITYYGFQIVLKTRTHTHSLILLSE